MLPTTHVTLQSVPVSGQALSAAITPHCMNFSLQSSVDDVLLETVDSDFAICLAICALFVLIVQLQLYVYYLHWQLLPWHGQCFSCICEFVCLFML